MWHGLNPAQLSGGGLSGQEQAVLTLLHRQEHSDSEVCAALSLLSSYSLENSRFYKLHPEQMAQVVSRVYAALEEYYGKNRKNDLCTKLFGRMYSSPHQMFQGAVFYQDKPHADAEYELTPLHRFHCKNDRWTRERFYLYRQKSPEAGALLKQIDYQLRQAWGFKSPLKPAELSKTFQSVLDKVMAQWQAGRAAEQACGSFCRARTGCCARGSACRTRPCSGPGSPGGRAGPAAGGDPSAAVPALWPALAGLGARRGADPRPAGRPHQRGAVRPLC